MSQSATSCAILDDVDALSGALFSWCAERGVRLRSQEVSVPPVPSSTCSLPDTERRTSCLAR